MAAKKKAAPPPPDVTPVPPKMTPEKALEQTIKLIALSSSSFEEEARTASFRACKLIREHKLHVSLEVLVEEASQEPVRADTPVQSKRDYPAREQEIRYPHRVGLSHRGDALVMGICLKCHDFYYPGDLVYFIARFGAVHGNVRCRKFWGSDN